MDLKEFAKVPTSPDSPAEEKAILVKIESCLKLMKKQLGSNQMKPGELQFRIQFLHDQILKVYGKESEMRKQFVRKYLLPSRQLTRPAAIELASDLVKKTEIFLNASYEIGNTFLADRNGKIFIGHGQSPLWRELKDFLSERLGLSWDEFNREAVAGVPTFERISQMLDEADFAFLIMTAEDEFADKSIHARENVVHEVGLFQGKLGPKKAIILLEEGCKEFSNIVGLSQIRFPKGFISAVFEEIRKVLEREGIINQAVER